MSTRNVHNYFHKYIRDLHAFRDWDKLRFLASRMLPKAKSLREANRGFQAIEVLRELRVVRNPVRRLWSSMNREDLVEIGQSLGITPPDGKLTKAYKSEVCYALLTELEDTAINFREQIPDTWEYRQGSFRDRASRFGGWIVSNWFWLLALIMLVVGVVSCWFIGSFVVGVFTG